MAEVKITKGSKEWTMFTDYWQLCQKYWRVEDNDKYWESLLRDFNNFIKKYEEVVLARCIAEAFTNAQEIKLKGDRRE